MEQVIRAQSLAPASGEPPCELEGHGRLVCEEGSRRDRSVHMTATAEPCAPGLASCQTGLTLNIQQRPLASSSLNVGRAERPGGQKDWLGEP